MKKLNNAFEKLAATYLFNLSEEEEKELAKQKPYSSYFSQSLGESPLDVYDKVKRSNLVESYAKYKPSRKDVYPGNIIYGTTLGAIIGGLVGNKSLAMLKGSAIGAAIGTLLGELHYHITKGEVEKAKQILERKMKELQ